MSPHRARRRRSSASAVVVVLGLLAGCSPTVAGTASAPADSSVTPSPATTESRGSEGTVPGSTVPGTGPESSTPASPTSDGAPGGIGEPGIGDPYYPEAGNGGYDVAGYDVTLTYRPERNELTATTTITATVTADEPLQRFNLDLQPTMHVDDLQVDGAAATFDHQQAELIVSPDEPLDPGAAFTVVVGYSGEPEPVSGGTSGLGDGGWYRTRSGGALVAGEPFSASAWFPANEHPADPATFAVTATVPQKWKVISNGLEQTDGLPTAPPGMHVSRWVQSEPVATYLTTLYIDTFTVRRSQLDDGTPVVSAFAPGDSGDERLHDLTPRVIEVLSSYFGDYPFDAVGGIYSDEPIPFALETATRPVYADWVDPDTVVHELAHQWYGDLVPVHRWRDICLNECFASYAPWLWHAEVDGSDLDTRWRSQMQQVGDDPGFWSSPLVDMGAGNEFTMVYQRGPLAVHALRHAMGERAFRELLRQWPATFAGRTATFEDLERMAGDLAGTDLTHFFDVWFRGTEPPASSDYPEGLR